jgi:glycosyltransferase involved in cell wall biosynthesis
LAASVSVVVMAYNEAASLGDVVLEIAASLKRCGGRNEIVIVDDGSSDGTGAAADALAGGRDDVRVVHHPRNGGLGAVYRTGFSEARGDYLTFFPADGQFPATIIEQFVPLMTDADVVLGWFHQGSEPLLARLLSACERLLYGLLFGPLPRFRGILMIRRPLVARMPLVSTGRSWVVLMEFLIKARRAGARFRSAVTEIRPRRSGASKVRNPRTVLLSILQVLELRLRI